MGGASAGAVSAGGVEAIAGNEVRRDDVIAAIRKALAEGKKVVVAIPGCVGEVLREVPNGGWFSVKTPKAVMAWPVFPDVPLRIEHRDDRLIVS